MDIIDIMIQWKKTALSVFNQLALNSNAAAGILHKKIQEETVPSLYEIMDLDSGSNPIKLKKPITGILTPLTLLEGHIQHFKKDWPKIINNYSNEISSDKIESKYILPLSSSTLWRLWGPSIEDYAGKSYEICQFGDGDEYNSIPVLIDRELLIKNEILDNGGNANPQRFVCPIRTKGILVSLKNKEIVEFFKKHYDEDRLSKLNNRFSKILILGKDLNRAIFKKNVIDQDPNFDVTNTKKSGSLFYSAYYWAELLIRDKDIEHTVFVFDHGNIATPELREQFVDILVYKIKYYFDKFGKDNITLGSCTFKNMRDKLNSDLDIKLNSKFN
jgi:hypothetical protein